MKYETLTKENIVEIFSTLYKNYEQGSDPERNKAKKLIEQYSADIDNIDVNLPECEVIAGINTIVQDPKKEGIEERFVLYETERGFHCFFFHHTKTGERFANIAEAKTKCPKALLVKPGGYKFSHFKYVEDLDILLIRTYHFITSDKWVMSIQRTKEYAIVTRDKQYYYIIPDSYWAPISKSTSWNAVPTMNIFGENKTNMHEEVKKMFKQTIFNMGANKFISLDYPQALEEFGKYKAKLEIKSGPKQNKIDELVAKKLPKVSITAPRGGRHGNEPYSKTIVQKVEDGLCVIRWILKSPVTGDTLDGFRIYIEGKNIHACKNDNKGSFIITSITNINLDNFLSCEMNNINPDDLKGTLLEYYGSIINDIPKEKRSLLLMLFIKEPKLEQIFKLGLGPIVCSEVNNYKCNALQLFEHVMSITRENKKEKNIFKYFGINKYTVDKIVEILKKPNVEVGKAATALLKSVYAENTISLDNNTIDNFFAILDKKNTNSTCLLSIASRFSYMRDKVKTTNNEDLLKNFEKMAVNLLRLTTSIYDVREYEDYIDMVKSLNDFRNFKLTFDTLEDVKEMHDAAAAVYNLKRYEYRAKAFKEQLVKVEKLEYENKDDDFCVVIPTEPGDLANEGMALHHCVKSYIERVANGNTNIVFIRKKTDKEKPFFTVEVSNDKSIEQVHGFGNRNANTEPGLEDFIEKWAKSKHLTLHSINKIR